MPRSKAVGCCTRPKLGWAAIVLLLAGEVAQGQLSKPVAHDSHWHKQENKFLSRKAENDKEGEEQKYDDLVGDNICPIDVELKWMTEVSSSVYATPLITDLYADGRKDIIVPGFVHYTEVLEGPDGAKALGWPAFHKSTVHASPLLYDIDSDGIRDILVATYDGEIVFFKDNGEMLNHRLIVPRLRVRKKWFVGVNPDPVDHLHPDVGAGAADNNPFEKVVHGARPGGKQGVASGPKSPQAAAAAVKTGQPQQPVQQQQAQPVQQQAQPVQQQAQQQAQPVQHQQPATATHTQVPAVATPTQAAVRAQGGAVQQQQQAQPQAQHQQAAQQQQQPVAQQQAQQQQQQQPAAAAATGQQGTAHARRRLMSVDSDDAEELTAPQRHLLQGAAAATADHAAAAAGGANVLAAAAAAAGGNVPSAAAAGGVAGNVPAAGAAAAGNTPAVAAASGSDVPAGGAAAANAPAAGVEFDPSNKPLTQEALDSFKVFEDEPPAAAAADGASAAAAAGGQAAQQQQQEPGKLYGSVKEPEEFQEGLAAADHAAAAADADAKQGAAAGEEGAADDAAAGEAAEHGEQYPYTYPTEAYDEFGDKLDQVAGLDGQQEGAAAAAGEGTGAATSGDAAGGAAAGQHQQEQQQQLRDLGDSTYNGGWKDDMWEDEMFQQAKHQLDEGYVYIDAHILCTPAIADIDNDQHDELVVAVSYFYDKEYYDDPAHAHELQGTDKEKYVAGGIVAFDLRTRVIKWQQHLDLTTATTKFTAHMFSSPTLADIDADGHMEIVVGTSVGFVYVLDSKGNSRPGWPIQMGEVQGQVMVADLNADGAVEIFAGDALGNVALLDINGKELWERHVKSMITQGGVAGDINGDGLLDIVFGTADGRVHAVRGTDGQPLQGFPFQTGGRIQAPATITQLTRNSRHQHVLIMSFDGFLYMIDGKSACAHTVDIGEASYAAVLVDDLAGDGMLELLVATMNGNVYMLQTQQRYHPAKTWSSQVQGINGMVARWGYFGFVATSEGRQLRDVAGQHLQVQVELWDARTLLHNGLPMDDPPRGPYNITVMLKGVGVAEMNAGPQPVIGVSDVLEKPGKTVVEIPCPRTRTTAAVHLDVITRNGMHFEDEFVLSFHMHFHKLLKWLIALPVLVMASVAVIAAQSYGFDAGRSPDRIV